MLSKQIQYRDTVQWYVPIISSVGMSVKFVVSEGALVDQSSETMSHSKRPVTFERVNIIFFSQSSTKPPILAV